MNKTKGLAKILLPVMVLFLCSACGSPEKEVEAHEVEKVYDYVLDVGTYTKLDYNFISEKFSNGYDFIGGCSVIAKQTENGEMLVGRNMDIYFSNNPAYIVRTNVEGCYQTIGVAYSFKDSWPICEQVLAVGLDEVQYKSLPFIATDIMNSAGLYVEINMRNAEFWVNGDSKFACTGTNQNAAERVNTQILGRYIAEHCANVEEAVEYVNGLNLFTGQTPSSWNFCFLLADASGHYGVLEIAQNRVIWHDGQPCQTNFYIDEELAAQEELKAGLGRYDYLMKNINSVQTEEDMYHLMDEVSYFSFYSEDCLFDPLSELVGTHPWWTNEYIEKRANREEVSDTLAGIRETASSLDEQGLRDKGENWLSVFTTVANCSNKTMTVRFFEHDEETVVLSFP